MSSAQQTEPAAATSPKKRGRAPGATGTTTRAQRIAELEQKLAKLKSIETATARKTETRVKIITGGTVIAMMQDDPELKAKIVKALRQRVTRQNDKKVIDPWLATI